MIKHKIKARNVKTGDTFIKDVDDVTITALQSSGAVVVHPRSGVEVLVTDARNREPLVRERKYSISKRSKNFYIVLESEEIYV